MQPACGEGGGDAVHRSGGEGGLAAAFGRNGDALVGPGPSLPLLNIFGSGLGLTWEQGLDLARRQPTRLRQVHRSGALVHGVGLQHVGQGVHSLPLWHDAEKKRVVTRAGRG